MTTMDHAGTVCSRFSARAHTYTDYAHVQRTLAQQLCALLPAERPATPVLEVGCGTGLLTQCMLRKWPGVKIHAIDIAPGMIRRAAQVLPDSRGVRWIVADAAHYRAPSPYALVASNCALHWVHPFQDGLRSLAMLVAPGGCFAAVIMLEGTLAELREARLRAAPDKPPAGRLPTFAEVEDGLHANGLQITYASEEKKDTSNLSAREILRMIHDQGLTGGHVSRSHAPLTRREIETLVREYEFNFRTPDGFVRASYRVGFFIARKPDAPHE
ncbi:MAG: methyltransferase domain-containing protein [bacterium]